MARPAGEQLAHPLCRLGRLETAARSLGGHRVLPPAPVMAASMATGWGTVDSPLCRPGWRKRAARFLGHRVLPPAPVMAASMAAGWRTVDSPLCRPGWKKRPARFWRASRAAPSAGNGCGHGDGLGEPVDSPSVPSGMEKKGGALFGASRAPPSAGNGCGHGGRAAGIHITRPSRRKKTANASEPGLKRFQYGEWGAGCPQDRAWDRTWGCAPPL